MNEQQMCFNGIDGATGGYLLPPLPPRTLAQLAQRKPLDPKDFHFQDLRWRARQARSGGHYAIEEGATRKSWRKAAGA